MQESQIHDPWLHPKHLLRSQGDFRHFVRAETSVSRILLRAELHGTDYESFEHEWQISKIIMTNSLQIAQSEIDCPPIRSTSGVHIAYFLLCDSGKYIFRENIRANE